MEVLNLLYYGLCIFFPIFLLTYTLLSEKPYKDERRQTEAKIMCIAILIHIIAFIFPMILPVLLLLFAHMIGIISYQRSDNMERNVLRYFVVSTVLIGIKLLSLIF